jgi:hypothetical protein
VGSWVRGFVGSSSGRVKPKTIKLAFVASPLSVQHSGERADWLARIQDDVSQGSDMSIRELLFQYVSKIKIQLIVFSLVLSEPHYHLIKCILN